MPRIQVCKRFRDVVDGTPLLQFIIERCAAGYNTDNYSSPNIPEALSSFRAFQRILRSPKPTLAAEVDLHALIPEVCHYTWHEWQHVSAQGILIGITEDRTALGVLSLHPSVPKSKRFRYIMIGKDADIEDVYLDVSQDLLVVIGRSEEISFRSFSTGSIHPRCTPATRSMMPKLPGNGYLSERVIATSRDWVVASIAVQFYQSGLLEHYFQLYHWPTGQLMMVNDFSVAVTYTNTDNSRSLSLQLFTRKVLT